MTLACPALVTGRANTIDCVDGFFDYTCNCKTGYGSKDCSRECRYGYDGYYCNIDISGLETRVIPILVTEGTQEGAMEGKPAQQTCVAAPAMVALQYIT